MRIFFLYIVDEHNMNFCSADMFEDYMGNNLLLWNNPLPRIYKTKVGYKKKRMLNE